MSWFFAFVYKAWRFSIRHYIRSLVTIILPLVPFIILVTQSNGGNDKIPNEAVWNQDKIIFPKTSKLEIVRANDELFVSYCPKNAFTARLMRQAKKILVHGNFSGYDNESEVENWFNSVDKPYKYGVLFKVNGNQTEPPHNLNYVIRGSDNFISTNLLFPIFQMPGPMEAGRAYINEGFLSLKIGIDDAFLSLIGMKPANWSIQEFPYPSHERSKESKGEIVAKIMPYTVLFFFMYLFSSITTLAVNEKANGIAERIRMFGVSNFVLLFGYIIHALLISIFSIVGVAILITRPAIVPMLVQTNIIIILIVLILFCIQSVSFFLAASSFFNNTHIAIFAASFLYILPFVIQFSIEQNSSFPLYGQVLSSLMPNLYLYWAFQNMYAFEFAGAGSNFGNIMRVPPSGVCGIPLFTLLLLSILGSILLSIIYCYISHINPGPYGYAKPWHFVIPKVESWFKITPSAVSKHKTDGEGDSRGLYERVPDNVEVGLKIVNLHKRFGDVIPIKKLSMDVYVGQITALLGHNGAGKTTTLSIISGISSPTSGSVLYRGYNIFTNLKQFQFDLGLCPQEDMLINDLSAWEHLLFFGMLKGISWKESVASATSVLENVGLDERKHVIASQLSGGMKRKLCLAVALIGNPKVIVLDEPTSGLDPESRREIWNILLRLRENKIMIITTHFMEEADALGDQIAIMDHGEIKCYGTPMFLKRNYGAGYQITICSNNASAFDDIIDLVLSKIPSATVLNKTDDSIVFNFGSPGKEKFSEVFLLLETKEEFGISRIGLNCTTMEDVFIKVGEEADHGTKPTQLKNRQELHKVHLSTLEGISVFKSFIQRLFALIIKNISYVRQKWFFFTFMVIILPVLISYWTINGTNSIVASSMAYPPLSFNLSIYGDTEVLIAGNENPDIKKSFSNIVKDQKSHFINVEGQIIDALLKEAEEDEQKFRQTLIVAGDFSKPSPNVLYSSIAIHAPPIAINLIYNSLLKAGKEFTKFSISTVHHPFTTTELFCAEHDDSSVYIAMLSWTAIVFCLGGIIGQCFIKFPHSERTTLLKHLQLMTGTSPFTYWISFFIWDLFVYCCCIALILLVFVSLDSNGILSVDNGAGVFYLIMFLFGWSGIWLAYCFSYLFRTSSNAFNCFYTGLAVLITATLVVFNIPEAEDAHFLHFSKYLLRLIPISPFISAIHKFSFDAIYKFKCSYCKNRDKIGLCQGTEIVNEHSYFTKDLNKELYFLAFDWVIYSVIIMLIEFDYISKLWNKLCSFYIGFVDKTDLITVETDVAKEKDRVDAVLQSGDGVEGASTLIVDSLAKKYSRTFTAVHEVTFATKEGECFGLLGVNGAGKSTTFNILTGIHAATQGNVIVKGYSLNDNKRKCLSYIGYCPQSSAIAELLTGKQMLTLFASLRLTEPSTINNLVDQWISLLGLEEYSDKPCGTYSGGNKRKLSAALAFISNPSIILLDEPTSGVDPVTRRKLWIVLKECQQQKQTVIISSHSMDECEAVCNRLTIMSEGYMKCIGTVQHLKSLYGQGFVILIKLKDHLSNDVTKLKESMLSVYDSKAILKDEHMVLLHYHIYEPTYKVSTLFSGMEKLKEKFSIIDDYTISDSSLEHVFLSFAKKNDLN